MRHVFLTEDVPLVWRKVIKMLPPEMAARPDLGISGSRTCRGKPRTLGQTLRSDTPVTDRRVRRYDTKRRDGVHRPDPTP